MVLDPTRFTEARFLIAWEMFILWFTRAADKIHPDPNPPATIRIRSCTYTKSRILRGEHPFFSGKDPLLPWGSYKMLGLSRPPLAPMAPFTRVGMLCTPSGRMGAISLDLLLQPAQASMSTARP